ncbi:hypothetical protein [Archangium violaceum]|uniref:hypothetical protein n=1 Tax=Archangium violaceum TaxID=83451 RepID=UPI001EF5076C|nr:hypothetical protein [Archangium violaceum]
MLGRLHILYMEGLAQHGAQRGQQTRGVRQRGAGAVHHPLEGGGDGLARQLVRGEHPGATPGPGPHRARLAQGAHQLDER